MAVAVQFAKVHVLSVHLSPPVQPVLPDIILQDRRVCNVYPTVMLVPIPQHVRLVQLDFH